MLGLPDDFFATLKASIWRTSFIVSWVDFCKKYEMEYALTDGSVGVHFNDSTRLVLKCESHAIPFGGDDMRMALRQWRPLGPRKMALRWKNENERLTKTIWWFDGDDIDLIFCSPRLNQSDVRSPSIWFTKRWTMTERRARWMTAAMTIIIIVVVSGILFLFFSFSDVFSSSISACGSGAGQVYSAVSG